MKLKLSDIYDLQMGKTPARNTPSFWDGVNAWVSISDMSTDEKYIGTTREGITDEAIKKTGIKIVPKGTLLMSFKLSVGKVAITAENVYTNEAIMAFIDKGNHDIDIDFMYHLFQSIDWTVGTNKAVKGLTLNKATLSEKIIELPPLDVQREIASTLDDVDEAKRILNSMLARNDDVVKSRFIEMFGDLALNPMNWKTMPIVEVCANKDDIKCGPFGTQLGKHEYVRAGVPLWGIPQINAAFAIPPTDFLTEEKAEQLSAYSLVPGDIAMSRKGNVGKCAIYPDGEPNGIIHSDVLRIRVNYEVCNPIFLMCQLHFSRAIEPQIDAVSNGAVMAGINVTKLKNINVHVPPIELQNQFAEFVQLADKSEYFNLLKYHKLLRLHVLERISSST